jgi:hypothetical protein
LKGSGRDHDERRFPFEDIERHDQDPEAESWLIRRPAQPCLAIA